MIREKAKRRLEVVDVPGMGQQRKEEIVATESYVGCAILSPQAIDKPGEVQNRQQVKVAEYNVNILEGWS